MSYQQFEIMSLDFLTIIIGVLAILMAGFGFFEPTCYGHILKGFPEAFMLVGFLLVFVVFLVLSGACYEYGRPERLQNLYLFNSSASLYWKCYLFKRIACSQSFGGFAMLGCSAINEGCSFFWPAVFSDYFCSRIFLGCYRISLVFGAMAVSANASAHLRK